MGDSEALVYQLQRSNRRWKALALFACSALVLAVLFGSVIAVRNQAQAERQRAAAVAALMRAEQASNAATAR